MEYLFVAWLALVAINIYAFVQFARDKRCAELGLRRIPENDLLQTALLGGWAGAYAGRAYFRHKTRKQPFSTQLHMTALFNIGLTAIALWWFGIPA